MYGSGFGMLLLGKTQKKHPGDLPPMVPYLPHHPLHEGLQKNKFFTKIHFANLFFSDLRSENNFR